MYIEVYFMDFKENIILRPVELSIFTLLQICFLVKVSPPFEFINQ